MILALFKTPVELASYLPEYKYLWYDLNRYRDEELQGAEILRGRLLLLKYIFRPELRERLPEILALVEQEGDQEALVTILRYIASGAAYVTVEDLQEVKEVRQGQTGKLIPIPKQ